MSVAILVPVLNRPQNVAPLMASVAAATPQPYRLLFVAQDDDTAELAALEQAGADYIIVPASRRSWACKINDGFRATTEPWVLCAADDLKFWPGWFDRALAWADSGVIGTNDLWNRRCAIEGVHSTHPLVNRAYIDQYGTVDERGLVLHEGYPHCYADDELVATAMARGQYTHAFDSIVQHLRPHARGADATYKLGEQSSPQGLRLFKARQRLWANGVLAPRPERAVVVTASYGGVDAVIRKPVAQDMPVDWVCFTDQPDLTAPAPWRVVRSPGESRMPRFAAFLHKAAPQVDCDDVVWVDASMEVTSPAFVREALAARQDGVAVFAHPRRDCVYAEGAALEVECPGKYDQGLVAAQVAAYRAEGYPERAGLYALGTIAWDLRVARPLGAAWLEEHERWGTIDQIPFPVVCRRLGIKPGVFPVPQIDRHLSRRQPYLANRWLKIHPHQASPAAWGDAVRDALTVPAGVSVLIPFAASDAARIAAFEYVTAWYRDHFPTWEVVVDACGNVAAWSKGAALQRAADEASHDVLVLADADSFMADPAVLAQAVALVADGAAWVMPHRKVHRLHQAHTSDVLDGAEPNLGRCHRSPYSGVVGGGITVLNRETWRACGVDPRFVGWGGEDMSYGWALETLYGPCVRLDGSLVHLWHKPATKGRQRRGSTESEALAARYRAARGKPDAMAALVAEFDDYLMRNKPHAVAV